MPISISLSEEDCYYLTEAVKILKYSINDNSPLKERLQLILRKINRKVKQNAKWEKAIR